MIKANNALLIEDRLQRHFQPSHLKVIDDSEAHRGHAGYGQGGRHFTVVIAADMLKSKSKVAAHREIYAVLADLMPEQIHALSIKIID